MTSTRGFEVPDRGGEGRKVGSDFWRCDGEAGACPRYILRNWWMFRFLRFRIALVESVAVVTGMLCVGRIAE